MPQWLYWTISRFAQNGYALLVGSIVATFLLFVPISSVQAQPELSFLDEAMKLTLDRRNDGAPEMCPPQTGEGVRASTANATVFVILSGSEQRLEDLVFRAKVKPDTGRWGYEPSHDEVAQSSVDVCWAKLTGNEVGEVDRAGHRAGHKSVRSSIRPKDVKAFVIFVEGHAPSKSAWWWLWYFLRPTGIPIDEANLTGHLVVKDASDAQVVQGTLPLRLNSVAPGYEGVCFYMLILCSLIGFFVAAYSIKAGTKNIPGDEKMEVPFKDRWAANLTGAGAVLGTILSAGVLPNDTFFMPKQQYLALNVLFGLIILLATVLSNLVGTVRAFQWACAAVLGAGVGEVITILFMLKEMQFQSSMPWGGVLATQVALILASPVFIVFARRNVIAEIKKPRSTQQAPGQVK